jgi:Tfp pilus assembly protein PilX
MSPLFAHTRQERGQTLLLFVLALTVLIGFVAMAIDVGLLFEDRRHLQNTADAAALAGVAELPRDPAMAKQKAAEWAVSNGVSSSEIKSVEVRTTDFPNDTLAVEVETTFDWIFGRVLGQTSSAVSAKAAAQVGSLAGGGDLMPWAMVVGESACLDDNGLPKPAADCSVKLGAESGVTGWYGALDLDGNGGGSSEYESNIIDGQAETAYCSRGQTEPDCEATQADALSGNKVGGTGQGIATRLQAEPTPGCDDNGNGTDDFNEVFESNTSGSSAAYVVVCPDSPRLVIIPIVTLNGIPVKTVTIEGWALAYLGSYSCVGDSTCGGKGHWEVGVTMVDAVYSQAAGFIGAFNPLSAVTVRRLIE